jgi:hypothetical protein
VPDCCARAARGVVVLCVALGMSGCERPYLIWTPREPLSARRGQVAISVEDHRAARGSLGRAFGWGGVPREIIVADDHVRDRLERLAKEATITAGLGLLQPAQPPTARLRLDVDTLDCDGTGRRAHAALAVRMTIVSPADGNARFGPQLIDARAEGRGCQAALAGALDVLLDELAARLVEGPAHEAALGG